MEYAVVRVVHNSNNYQRPSGGKLGKRSESSYARTSGFGHEEWNFNTKLQVDGRVHGYHYYKPTEKKRNLLFNLFFTTYSEGQWKLVGIYREASYSHVGWPSELSVLKQKLRDLRNLGEDLGPAWAALKDKEIVDKLQRGAEHDRWSVDPADIVVPPSAIHIPTLLRFDNDFRKNFHETTATLITASDARQLELLLGKVSSKNHPKAVRSVVGSQLPDIELDAIEGSQKLVSHLKRERSPKLVKAKKRSVYELKGMLSCEVCSFDFHAKYGQLGDHFCEVHHLKRLSDVKEGSVTTNLSDLAIVCSNCHRMLHRGVPMLTLKKLHGHISAAERKRGRSS